MRTNEIKKEEVVAAGEKKIDTSNVTPHTIEIEDQSASTKQLSVITITIVVLSLVPPISTKKALVTIKKYGTKVKLGQESNPVATPQMQGEA